MSLITTEQIVLLLLVLSGPLLIGMLWISQRSKQNELLEAKLRKAFFISLLSLVVVAALVYHLF